MGLRFSTGFRDKLMNRVFNGSTAAVSAFFDSGSLQLRTGAQPADADTAPIGTLIEAISVPADSFAAASTGNVAKSGTWASTAADTSGTAGYFMLVGSTDAGTTNTADHRITGTIGTTGSGADLELDNTSINAGQAITINTFTLTFPTS